jgi:4-amino-4-deoxy-L-arabinose transferase-like glycosyltransferase
MRSRLIVAAVALATLAACLVGLGAPLPNSDDALFAWAVRDAVRAGRWLDYQWFGASFQLAYPPLGFVLIRLGATLLGPTEIGMRLGPALCAWGTAMATFAIARRLTGAAWAGALAALSLPALGVFYYYGRGVLLDAPLGCALALTLLFALRALDRPSQWWAAGALAGAAMMIKGLSALPPLVGLLSALLSSRPRPPARGLLVAAAVAAAIALPWHAWQAARLGAPFVAHYFGYNLLARYSHAIVGARAPWHY